MKKIFSQKPLSYSFSDLEPNIDSKTLELHYTKHHTAYINGLNQAQEKLDIARNSGDFSFVKHLKKEIAFHGSGHFLHELYFDSMAPKGKKIENLALLDQIKQDFYSFEIFEKEFKSSALVVEGSGWAVLGVSNGKLEIYTIEKHQDLFGIGTNAILACDVWEHAYYLKYQNRRVEYIDSFFEIINWENVNSLFEKYKNI